MILCLLEEQGIVTQYLLLHLPVDLDCLVESSFVIYVADLEVAFLLFGLANRLD